MKEGTMGRITRAAVATTIATGILLGGSAMAFAEDGGTPPAVQQSNIQPTDEMLTEEILIVPGGAALSERMGPSNDYLPSLVNEKALPSGTPIPDPASASIQAVDGTSWRLVKLQLKGHADEDFYYVPEAAVASSAKLGSYEATAEAARQAKYAEQDAHNAKFQGEGTVKAGAGWYASEDSTKTPIAVAEGLGFEVQMTEPYDMGGKQWRKISIYSGDAPHTYFVLDSDTINYVPKPMPTETTGVTGATMAPEVGATMPAVPEGMQAADATTPVANVDQPTNLGLMFGIGLGALVVVGAGGYLYIKRRKVAEPKTAATADEAQEEN